MLMGTHFWLFWSGNNLQIGWPLHLQSHYKYCYNSVNDFTVFNYSFNKSYIFVSNIFTIIFQWLFSDLLIMTLLLIDNFSLVLSFKHTISYSLLILAVFLSISNRQLWMPQLTDNQICGSILNAYRNPPLPQRNS